MTVTLTVVLLGCGTVPESRLRIFSRFA